MNDPKRVGGVAGVGAEYADMRYSGELLMGISTTFLADAVTIGGFALDPDVLSSAVFAPIDAVRVEARLAGIGTSLGADAVEFGVLGTFLVGAVEAYELADEVIAGLATGLANVAGYAVGLALPVIALVGGSQFLGYATLTWGVQNLRGLVDPNYDPQSYSEILGDQAGDIVAWLADHPETIDLITRGAPGFVSGLTHSPIGNAPFTFEQTIALILGLGSVGGYFHDGNVTVRPVDSREGDPLNVKSVRGLDDAFVSLGEIDEYDQDPQHPKGPPEFSRIRVIKSVGDDGVTRWIVQIPSTQSWDPKAGPAANDVTACLLEMGGNSSALETAVREAMIQAGVGKGDPVLLNGFSLGGITAGHLASDPGFTKDYNVEAVLTAGAPTARFDIGSDVQVLSIEHNDDMVPHLDSMDNPDRANWTTLYADTPEIEKPSKSGEDPKYYGAHSTATYADTARRIENMNDPSVDYYMNQIQPFLDGDQTATDYRADRTR